MIVPQMRKQLLISLLTTEVVRPYDSGCASMCAPSGVSILQISQVSPPRSPEVLAPLVPDTLREGAIGRGDGPMQI